MNWLQFNLFFEPRAYSKRNEKKAEMGTKKQGTKNIHGLDNQLSYNLAISQNSVKFLIMREQKDIKQKLILDQKQ